MRYVSSNNNTMTLENVPGRLFFINEYYKYTRRIHGHYFGLMVESGYDASAVVELMADAVNVTVCQHEGNDIYLFEVRPLEFDSIDIPEFKVFDTYTNTTTIKIVKNSINSTIFVYQRLNMTDSFNCVHMMEYISRSSEYDYEHRPIPKVYRGEGDFQGDDTVKRLMNSHD